MEYQLRKQGLLIGNQYRIIPFKDYNMQQKLFFFWNAFQVLII